MGDVIYLLTIVGFFLLCALYVKGCERIVGPDVELETVEDDAELGGEGIPTPVGLLAEERAA